MKLKTILGFFLILSISASTALPIFGDELLKEDFQKESFAKTVDYFDYARAWAHLHGMEKPPESWHANVYVAYVNKTGLQLLYSGLYNVSLADRAFLTIPTQSILMRYKTEENSRDVLVASSFLMLMGFNDTSDSIYDDSPDKNDTLWSSFSFGLNLKQMFPNLELPSFNSESKIYQLTSYDSGLTWKWGMKYSNLTALWITTQIAEGENETDIGMPWGLVTYDELTFNYTFTIDPENHKATLSQDHVIGRMRDLWVFGGWFLVFPVYNHYNSTGCYRYEEKVSNETIYQFLDSNEIKMSIVEYQTSVMLERDTYSTSSTGENVADSEVFVSDSVVTTYAEDGEKILESSFNLKKSYNLFDYSEDPGEETSQSYIALTRTTNASSYVENEDLFKYQRNFAKYLPLILVHMYPKMFQKANETVTDSTRADYFFIISYPNYSGYRIEHDPLYTFYYAPTQIPSTGMQIKNIVIIAALMVIIVIAIVILRRRL